ncbi:glycosyltransferase family 39 protein [Candidatus Sumerlaeota bacterium]|nr:glycosyltransferase family 39 protein [Candidatus Sumerlaeota bacterium]
MANIEIPHIEELSSYQTRHAVWLLLIVWAAFFLAQMLAPSNLMDNDQERPAAYVLDVTRNGHWACQRDEAGDVASKPPLYTWLAALTTLPFGKINLFAIYLPSALSVLGTTLLIFYAGRRWFNPGAGLCAAYIYLLSSTSLKQVALARNDPVFTFTVTLTWVFLLHNWLNGGRRWIAFWFAAAAATLTKGPLGLVFASGGLWALLWERRCEDRPRNWVRPAINLAGAAFFLGVTLGWVILAYKHTGQNFIDKVLVRELAGHAVSGVERSFEWDDAPKPFLYFLSRFAPWSLIALLGFWRTVRQPAGDADERRAERFLFTYFFWGMLLLTLASHKRADLNFPLLPAAALLAGREIERWLHAIRPGRVMLYALAAALLLAVVSFAYLRDERLRKVHVRQTQLVIELARRLTETGGAEFPVNHFYNAPFAAQFFLNTMRPELTVEESLELLRGPLPAYVLCWREDPLWWSVRQNPKIHEALTLGESSEPQLCLLSNQPDLRPPESFALILKPWKIYVEHARLKRADIQEIVVEPLSDEWRLEICNGSGTTAKFRLGIANEHGVEIHTRQAAPGSSYEFKNSGAPDAI